MTTVQPDGASESAEGPFQIRHRISVIIPVYNKLHFLHQTIPAVLAAVRADGMAELTLVDNGSSDGSWEFLTQYREQGVEILRLPHATVAAVRNHGVASSRGELLLFLDCDILIPENYLQLVREAFGTTKATGVGCRVGLPTDPTWVESTWHWMHARSTDGSRQWINSGNFAVTREAFERVGRFDEDLISGEDPELCQRLNSAGEVLFELQKLRVVHLDNAKTLNQFYRKEVWRALGMFGTTSGARIDRPVLMTVSHLLLIVGSCVVLSLGSGRPIIWALCLIGPWAVPTAAVLYRRKGTSRAFSIPAGILLYQAYFLARITALFRVIARRIGARSGSRKAAASSVE